MVLEHRSYRFSSYPAFIGQVKAPKQLELNWLLSLFGPSRRNVAKNYCDFVEKVDITNLENPVKDISGGFILGGFEKENIFQNMRCSVNGLASPSFRADPPKSDVKAQG